jgi:hypothetical protein
MEHAVLRLELPALLLGAAEPFVDHRVIVGIDGLEMLLVGRFRVGRQPEVMVAGSGGVELASIRGQFPMPQVGGLHRKPVALLALAQRLLRTLALGDVYVHANPLENRTVGRE